MKFSDFSPGKDGYGKVPLLDGQPIFYVKDQYYLSRAKTARGILWDAWFKPAPKSDAIQLAGGVDREAALKACEDHSNGLPV